MEFKVYKKLIKKMKILKAYMYLIYALVLILSKTISSKKINILIINHFFDGEIEQLLKDKNFTDQFNIVISKPQWLFRVGFIIFPIELHNGEERYDSAKYNEFRSIYRKISKFIIIILKYAKIRLIITPSDSFFWIREPILIANVEHILTLVVDKEGTLSEYDYRLGVERVKQYYPPIAKYFAVWSKRQSDFWRLCGVPIDRIVVTGSIRVDGYVNGISLVKNNVLMYDFDKDAYINGIDLSKFKLDKNSNWDYLRTSYHKALRDLALKNKKINFYLKCHPQQVHTELFADIGFLPNVKIITGSAKGLLNIVTSSIVVIGFQTTGLLEASISNTHVIYGAWGEIYRNLRLQLLPWDMEEYGFNIASSEDEIIALVQGFIDNPKIPQRNNSGVNRYFNNPDGAALTRLNNFIVSILEVNDG
jgi:hypothetical protein